MYSAMIIAAAFATLPPASTMRESKLEAAHQWAQWRGPLGTGASPHGNPPVTWGVDKNIRWKTAIPGRGQSTPIVWGDRIFLTTAIPYGETLPSPHDHAPGAHNNVSARRKQNFVVLALRRSDGTILWQQTVGYGRPHDSTHETGTWASNSAVTDGEHVYAYFGSNGLYALDFDGDLLWEQDLGDMHIKHGHGEGSSPALYGDTLIINWDHRDQSFVIAIDKRTGKQRWKMQRDEGTSWSTPLVVEHNGRQQVIISATNRVRAYDLSDGHVIWECAGLSGNVVASPVAADGMVYVANSYETQVMLAIRLEGAKGDITGTNAVVWTRDRHTPYVPSPLLFDGHLYYLKHYQGVLTCVDAKTGKTLYGPQRVPGIGNVYASLVGAADRVYIVSLNGTTAVLRRGDTFELVAQNTLNDTFAASPAIVGNELYLRGARHLYCIASVPHD